ncbi:sugar ABC transporter ATP-binding protein [Mesorhizobium neociceri]|uniref:Sugar ABC transporter ATP-binding protein n=1 Tax=Mesorhizobium neociceri TaxID=1307853 RepID=A0A838B813_9HYPH|nr:sugar ABC transporter ATP-binding protein [Mesorhizobium neociceri]MBA1141530.1 sugar ABC transporter ATP-binding protein [Mesorhizobium neociceri]
MLGSPIMSVRNLAMRYGGVVALRDMNLYVGPGTIHAVIGESGAGKSTLVKVLAGVVRPDSGTIRIGDQTVAIDSSAIARKHGLGVVYQDLSLFPDRSVLANLFVGREPLRNGLISTREMEARSRTLLRQLELNVDVRAPVGHLDMGERQLVELARELLQTPRLLILDEPNSALDRRETEHLFTVLRGLKAKGMSVLYVSHRLEDVFAIADHITVMRNGRDVLTKERSGLSEADVIDAMIGQQRDSLFPPALSANASTIRPQITVEGLSGGRISGVSFTARSGEVLGFAGLEGSGVEDLFEMLFGLRKAQGGTVRFPDGHGLPKSPTEAARRGIGLLPADRRCNGLMPDRSLAFNIGNIVAGARNWGSRRYSPKAAIAGAARQIDALRIKSLPDAPVNSLLAGDQQKIVIAKWLETAPQVLLLDNPAGGIEAAAKRKIYALIRQMAANGCIVLLRSVEPSELTNLSNRVLVFHRGRVAGEVFGAEMKRRTVLHLITTGEMPEAERPKKKLVGSMA